MAALSKKHWASVQELYESGLSMREIGEKLNVSINAITYLLRKLNVPRRSLKEASRIKFAQAPLTYKVRIPHTQKEQELQVAGAMIYWAAGYKTTKASGIDLANSNPDMVKTFIRFLRSRYAPDEKRFRVLLYCFSDQHSSSLITFWSTILNIPATQFSKPYVRPGNTAPHREMKYGMIHLRYHDKKMLNDLRNLIDSYVQRFG